MLDVRKAAILYAVVQEYIDTAQPVGSLRVSDSPGVDASPATVRSEMAALESEQYLGQPHTSAGRVPTVKGYRFFVDQWRERPPRLDVEDRRQLDEFFAASRGEFEALLLGTAALLSDLTHSTAVVVAPSPAAAIVRSAHLVELAAGTVMAVAVMSSGVIEKRNFTVPADTSPTVLDDASRRLASRIVGRTLCEVEECGDGEDPLLAAAIRALREAAEQSEMFVGGTWKLAGALGEVHQLSEVLSLLEEQFAMVELMRRVIERGNRVAIGEETGLASLTDCSIVLAPYDADGASGGAIGVIGPTRMDYPQVLSAVAAVSEQLGPALGEG